MQQRAQNISLAKKMEQRKPKSNYVVPSVLFTVVLFIYSKSFLCDCSGKIALLYMAIKLRVKICVLSPVSQIFGARTWALFRTLSRVQWWVHGAPDVLLAFWGDCTHWLHLLSLSLSLSLSTNPSSSSLLHLHISTSLSTGKTMLK